MATEMPSSVPEDSPNQEIEISTQESTTKSRASSVSSKTSQASVAKSTQSSSKPSAGEKPTVIIPTGLINDDNSSRSLSPSSPSGSVVDDGPIPSIIYQVQINGGGGNQYKYPQEPFKLKRSDSDLPVLEVYTTVVQLDKSVGPPRPFPPPPPGGRPPPPGPPPHRPPPPRFPTAPSFRQGGNANDPDKHPENFKVSGTTLRIRSRKLINALRAVVKYYPGQTLLGDTLSFSEPFQLLVHHRAELEDYKSRNPENHGEEYKKTCNEHIDILLDFLKNHFGKALEDEEERHRQNPPVCTFEFVWLLLKPGEPCYFTGERNKFHPATIKSSNGGMLDGFPRSYQIYNWNVRCDGVELGRVTTYCYILPFDGEKEIESLMIFPKRFHQDTPEDLKSQNGLTLEQTFIERGRKYWELTKYHCYKGYEGSTILPPYRQIDSRIIVDFASFYAREPIKRPKLSGAWVFDETMAGNETATGTSGCECEECAMKPEKPRQGLYQDYDCVALKAEPPNQNNFFFLCTNLVPAFILNERKWEELRVDFVKDIDVQREAYDNLVLEGGIKQDIEALCRTHLKAKKSKSGSADFIKGKGEGLIFLLHGPPGVGKTLTAESIAELLERPLLALTCSDLGTAADEVGSALDTYLTLGELWGAVVLLDEADVYFEARGHSDVKRNSMVTVFLRALEYYRGLLFLTTNRVNTFDEAFKSRIHVSMHYKRLSRDQQSAIWKNCFARAKKDSVVITKKSTRYVSEDSDLLEREWNGREIQNAFQTALALARFDAEDEGTSNVRVKAQHLKRVVGMSMLFSKYLGSMRGGKDDDEVALQHRLRNDNFGQSEQAKTSKKAQVAAAAAKKKKKVVKKKAKETESEDESEEDSDQESEEVSEATETEGEAVEETHKRSKKSSATKHSKAPVKMTEETSESESEEEEQGSRKKKGKNKKVSKREAKSTKDSDSEDNE